MQHRSNEIHEIGNYLLEQVDHLTLRGKPERWQVMGRDQNHFS